MEKQEKEKLRLEYQTLKYGYKSLKDSLSKVPSDSIESYEIRGEMSGIVMRMQEIRKTLIDATFSRVYPTTLLENFVFGSEEKVRGGR